MSGTLTHSPDQIIQQLLVDLATGTLPESADDWPVFCSVLPEDPDNLLATIRTAGIISGRHQYDGEVQEHYGIQITVRGITYPLAASKAQATIIELTKNVLRANVTIDSTDYTVQSVSLKSGPIPLLEHLISKRQLFTINVIAAIRQT